LEIVQVHVAVEPFFAALKAVHAGKAEEVEDEASGSAMRAVYPCPVGTVLPLTPRNLPLSTIASSNASC